MGVEEIAAIGVAIVLMLVIVWLWFLGGMEVVVCGWLELDSLATCS